MTSRMLSVEEFYTGVARYMETVDPAWAEESWRAQAARERQNLAAVMGPARGRSVLDCSCGGGGQAIPLAASGWRVTASDVAESVLATARRRAEEQGVEIDFRMCDMRELGRHFRADFDWAISCMALDNLADDDQIRQALAGLRAALKPGGRCYLRLRDLEHIRAVRPRYELKEERAVPHGRVIRLEDWEYESKTHLVCAWAFLREDTRKLGYRWESHVFRYRRRVVPEQELKRWLMAAGFERVELLPQPSPWSPYEVIAHTVVGGDRRDAEVDAWPPLAG